jgi:hypothetical protein
MIDGGAVTCVKLCEGKGLCNPSKKESTAGDGLKSGRLVFGVKLFDDGPISEKGLLKLFMMMRVNSRIHTVLNLISKQLFKNKMFCSYCQVSQQTNINTVNIPD